jgi:hypothetical protein
MNFCARRLRGSSLLLVLWAIMLMSFAVIGLVAHLSRGLDESLHAEKEFRARLLLQSARTLAAHPEIEWAIRCCTSASRPRPRTKSSSARRACAWRSINSRESGAASFRAAAFREVED